MASSLQAVPSEMHEIVTVLSSKVKSIIGDAGWAGDAASQFSQKWSADSITAGALAEATKAVGDTLGELAATLEAIDRALYNAAHDAKAQGVPIGPDGKPPTVAIPTNPSPDDQKMLVALQGYIDDYNHAMEAARNARLVAEEKLRNVYDAIGPDQQSGSKLTASQDLTVGGYIKSLYAIPASRTRDILKNGDAELAAARQALKDTRPAYQAAKQAYEAKGMNLPKDNPARIAHSQAVNELRDIEGKIDAAEKGETTNTMSTAFDTRVGDLGRLASTAGRLPKFLEFAKDIPVLGIVTTGIGAGIDTKTDVDKGDTPEHAASVNSASGYGGLAVGIGAAGLIAAAPVDVPVVAAVTGSTLAAVVGGDAIKEGLNEHWSEDIHNHGVVGGIGRGIGNIGVNTAKDVSGLFGSLWHTVAG